MGTRGLWGFVCDGKEYLTYCHFDSYPDGLGADLVEELGRVAKRKAGLEDLRGRVREIRMVAKDGTPTAEDQERLARFANTTVSTRSTEEWYVLLRNTQGDMDAALRAGVMIDDREFAGDSLWCEWAYVLDLDAEKFEVYKGFQHEPHEAGRFAKMPPILRGRERSDSYYPVRRIGSFPLLKVPEDWIEQILPGEDGE